MFDEIRYELNGVEIDRCKNVGITSTIKNYASLSHQRARIIKSAGWDVDYVRHGILLEQPDFSFCLPLYLLLGFCEDYKRMVINARHELILIRARNDNNVFIAQPSNKPKITLLKIQWRMLHVVLNDVNKLSLLQTLESGRYLNVAFSILGLI